jgi:hypothetical protein
MSLGLHAHAASFGIDLMIVGDFVREHPRQLAPSEGGLRTGARSREQRTTLRSGDSWDGLAWPHRGGRSDRARLLALLAA